MQTTQGSMLETLRAVQGFLDANAGRLGGLVQSGSRRQLDDVVAQLSGHAAAQSGSSQALKGGTQRAKTLRSVLVRDHMTPVARIAAVDLPSTPELQAALKLPKGRPTAEKLAAVAYGMGKTATPFASTFVAAGLPADFIDQLNGAADALLAFASQRKQTKGQRGTATQGLKTMLSAGGRIVKVLDAMVRSALKDDPALLAGWNQVKKTRKASGRPPTPAGPLPIPGVTPAPAPINSNQGGS